MFWKRRRERRTVVRVERPVAAPAGDVVLPAVAGLAFDQVDLDEVGRYVGATISAIDVRGRAEPAVTAVGRPLRQRLRDAGRPAELAPGEILPGQAARREERLRAEGLTDDQIEVLHVHITKVVSQPPAGGWDVVFGDGHRAAVRLVAHGTGDADDFTRLRDRFRRERGAALTATVQQVTGTPFEAYELAGHLTAEGATHVALVQSPDVDARRLVRLAAVALGTIET